MARDGDQRWITQYGSLFCVLNSSGEVVTWKLTSGVSFDVVKDILSALRDRLESQNRKPSQFYVDNCCAWRKKLTDVFGHEMEVKLDIFHAVKRVGEKISKRHPLRKVFMDDWRLVFRDPSDRGKDRHLVTPSPDVLEANLDKFYQQWKSAEYNGQLLLNSTVEKEMKNIRGHMKKGCLSGIGPGRGTNRNEGLHKNLNSIMSSSRYGVELAYSLFTTCFYKHNERMSSMVEQRSENPVEFYQVLHADTTMTPEKFGLRFEDVSKSTPTTSKVNIGSCTFQEAYLRINGESTQHARERINITGNDEDHHPPATEDDFSSNSSTLPSAVDADQFSISVSTLKDMLMKALAWHFTYKALSSVSETAFIDVKRIPFIATSLNLLFDPITLELSSVSDEEEQHKIRLDQVLRSWNFERFPSPQDGDCLFHAIVHNLKVQVENGNVSLGEILQCSGINVRNSLQDMIVTLRRLVVAEWLGEFSEEYQGFMTSDQLNKQADQLLEQAGQFLNRGDFATNVGDLVIAAVSNMC